MQGLRQSLGAACIVTSVYMHTGISGVDSVYVIGCQSKQCVYQAHYVFAIGTRKEGYHLQS